MLKTYNENWRSFQKRVEKNFLANEHKRNPLETYLYMEKIALQKFNEMISSKEFQV